MTMSTEELAARVAHEANNAYNALIGDPLSPAWEAMTDKQRAGVIEGVRLAWSGATPEQSHENWCRTRREEGWVHGPVKSFEHLTHPCLVPYSELPETQRQKDATFQAIALAFAQSGNITYVINVESAAKTASP